VGCFGLTQRICQSCGMPLQKEEYCGTNTDGSKSKEYCFHCFQKGSFIDEGITLQGKIDKNVKFAVQKGMSEDEAKKMASDVLPKLKRWKTEA
jgi:Putative zinc ribbon domain